MTIFFFSSFLSPILEIFFFFCRLEFEDYAQHLKKEEEEERRNNEMERRRVEIEIKRQQEEERRRRVEKDEKEKKEAKKTQKEERQRRQAWAKSATVNNKFLLTPNYSQLFPI